MNKKKNIPFNHNKNNNNNKNYQKDGHKKMRQFNLMMRKLHEMLRTLGQDQFQKLRRTFTISAQQYEKVNFQLKNTSQNLIKAKLTLKIIENKQVMKQILQEMTKSCMRLKNKVEKQKIIKKNTINQNDKYKTPSNQKKKKKMFHSSDQDEILITDRLQLSKEQYQKSPQNIAKQLTSKTQLQQQLQYKTLTLYSMQKIYFKLINTERPEVSKIKYQIKNKKFKNLEELKKAAQQKRLIQDLQDQSEEQQDTVQEKQMLEMINMIDEDIELKMVGILEGVNKLHQHAKDISKGLDDYHEKILINIAVVDENVANLEKGQKMMQQVIPYGKKSKCICNVILLIILALVAYLLIRMFVLKETNNNDNIVSSVNNIIPVVNNLRRD